MRKITAAVVAVGVTGVTLVGLAGAASAGHPPAAAQPAAAIPAVGAATLAGTDAGAAGEADATNAWIKRPTTSYSSPSNESARVHTLHANSAVQAVCFTEGQTLHGNFYWFRILHNGDLGFVHRDAIAPPADLRHC